MIKKSVYAKKPEVIHMKDTKNHFMEAFNRKTGFYMRTGVIDERGVDTGVDPFMRSFPGLLDIGIMGGCKAASLGLCKAGGNHSGCYQGARKYDPEKDMKFEEYQKIIDEGYEKGLQQVALGGAGNPNDHRDFVKILEYTHSKGIIPNYTTAGIELTDEMVEATKKYCGAVAVSWYNQKYSVDAINKFLDAGCKTSIHFVLSRETIDTAIDLLKTNTLGVLELDEDKPGYGSCYPVEMDKINAVIFLLYKPVGLGVEENMLTLENDREKIEEFFSLIDGSHPFKIGFDSCTIPAVLKFANNVDPNSTDTCEGGRFSAYINADMIMVPCSFDQKLHWGMSLRDHTVEEVWNSQKFNNFRGSLSNSCPGCKNRKNCMGGCPIKNQIVLCDSPERKHVLEELPA